MSTGPVTEVLGRATSVEDVRPGDARAGADYQPVTAGGQAYFLKRPSQVPATSSASPAPAHCPT